jgi:2,4-diketo-3-deoxy-L-fuconate hydrolase
VRLYTFEIHGQQRIGVEQGEQIVDLTAAGLPSRMFDLIAAGEEGLAQARHALEVAQTAYALADVRVLAPLPRPGKILCSGVNYRTHGDEGTDATLPSTPGCFSKLPTAVIGPGEPIVHPRMTEQLDYEVELAVVIGRMMRRVPEEQVMSCIFGYTIIHDVSARDIQFKAPMHNQITLGKNFDTFAPMGPCIVTADELPDPENLGLRTFVNGEMRQDASNKDWLFSLPYMLSFFSHVMTLEAGDIVTTGTPGGVGAFRQPPVWLKPDDICVLEIDRIGRLQNPIVAE